MKHLMLAAVLAAYAAPAAAESLAGVTVGEPEAITRARFPNATVEPAPDAKDRTILTQDGLTVQFCRGQTVSVTETIGHDLPAFTGEVARQAEERGEPDEHEVVDGLDSNADGSDGEHVSYVSARWQGDEDWFAVEIWQTGQAVEVTRTAGGDCQVEG